MFCFSGKQGRHVGKKVPGKKVSSARDSLIGSVASLVLCSLLFVGTTFAWYTSNVQAPTSEITVGNMTLNIGHYTGTGDDAKWTVYDNSNELKWTLTKVNKGSSSEEWEPGDVGTLDSFCVLNTGTLGVNYKVSINGITSTDGTDAATTMTILDNLQFYLKKDNGELTPIDIYTLADIGTLSYKEDAANKKTASEAGEAVSKEYTIVCKMNMDAPDTTMNKGIDSLSVSAYAVQVIDSQDVTFGDTLVVKDYETLKNALAVVNETSENEKITKPMTIKLIDDIVCNTEYTWTTDGDNKRTGAYTVSGDWENLSVSNPEGTWVVLDLNGHDLYGKQPEGKNSFITVSSNATLAITDNSTAADGKIVLEGESYSYDDGTEHTVQPALFANEGRLIITGGTFKDNTKNHTGEENDATEYTKLAPLFLSSGSKSPVISEGTFDFDVSDFVKFSSVATLKQGNLTIKKDTDGNYYQIDTNGKWVYNNNNEKIQATFETCTVTYDPSLTPTDSTT